MRDRAPRLVLVGAIVCLAFQSTPYAGEQNSLIDLARSNGGRAALVVDVCGGISTVESNSGPSSLIVRGAVRSATAKLSADGTSVVTEYEFVPSRFYKGSLPPLSRPGPPPPLRFAIPFGTLYVDGLRLSTSVNIFPAAEMPRPGEELIVFLYQDPHWKMYALWGGGGAAFRVVDGHVIGLTKQARETTHDAPQTIAQFEQRLSAALSESQR